MAAHAEASAGVAAAAVPTCRSLPLLAFSPEAAKALVERTCPVARPGGARDRRGKPDQLPGVAVGGGECPEREGSTGREREREPAVAEHANQASPCLGLRVVTQLVRSRF
jgi:hypothetical protein